jgi:hypothetical protein
MIKMKAKEGFVGQMLDVLIRATITIRLFLNIY